MTLDLEIPPAIRARLESHGPATVARVEDYLRRSQRPCLAVTSERVAAGPLHPSLWGRVRGQGPHPPVLGPLASKFGGTPYRERDDGHDWDGWTFVCQVNIAELPPVPEAPTSGLFAIDAGSRARCGFRVRTYAEPSDERYAPLPATPRSMGRWEARMRFEPAWHLPVGSAWEAAIEEDDDDLAEMWFDWFPTGPIDDGSVHRVFGHRCAFFEDEEMPAPFTSREVDYTTFAALFRMTYDNVADFGLGTNWVNVLVPEAACADGRLEGAVVAVTNW